MDLKQQLVIWKKAGYLQSHMALTPRLCDRLVEEAIFTASMMAQVQSENYNVEKTLRLLSLLGTHGEGVWDKFLRALTDSNQGHVTKELNKTVKFTEFGEMLPPAFTYFMDMSEFLKRYPHISVKLGEDHKHILQTFIEGKIEVEAKKHEEHVQRLQTERDQLKQTIADMKGEVENGQSAVEIANARLAQAEHRIEDLKNRIKDLDIMNREHRAEIRRLKHFHRQQGDLDRYLRDDLKEYLPATEKKVQNSEVEKESEDQVDPSELLRIRLLESQVNLQVIKLDLIRTTLKHLDGEEKRLQELTQSAQTVNDTTGKSGSKIESEVKVFSSEFKKVKRGLDQQLKDGEKDLAEREKELNSKEQEFNVSTEIRVETYSDLVSKLQTVIHNMKRHNIRKLRDLEEKHEKEIDEFVQRLQVLNQNHMDEIERYRLRVKQKMMEIHKREMHHKRMRNQIVAIERYHAKNMNSTQTIEQCRKVVRAVISDARKLKQLADEREIEKAREEQERLLQEKLANDPRARREYEKQKKEEEEEKEKANKKKKKKKRRKRVPESLSDERLLYVSERVWAEWRQLGSLLDLTPNRLDMAEMEANGLQNDSAYKMLQAWRDEDAGKVEHLITALEELGRDDLANFIMPLHQRAQVSDLLVSDMMVDTAVGTGSPSMVPKLPSIAAR